MRRLLRASHTDADVVSRMLECAPSSLKQRLRACAMEKAATTDDEPEVTGQMLLDCAPESVKSTLLDCALQKIGGGEDVKPVLRVLEGAARMDVKVAARTYNKLINTRAKIGDMEVCAGRCHHQCLVRQSL